MDIFKVTILGCGSAKPSPRHLPSSQVVNFRGNLIMIDCGEGAQMQFFKMKFNPSRLRQILISHLHGDHCYGLPGMLSTLGLKSMNGTIDVRLPEEGVRLLEPLVEYSSHQLQVNFTPYEYKNAIIYEDKALEISTVPLVHSLPCVGFILREKPKQRHINPEMVKFYQVPVRELASIKEGNDFTAADGTVVANERLTTPADPSRTYAYISDTLPLKRTIQAVEGVDLLYHEATFLTSEKQRAKETCHSTAADAARIAKEAGVKRLVIGHFSSRYVADEDRLLKEAQSIFPDTILANEGMTLDV